MWFRSKTKVYVPDDLEERRKVAEDALIMSQVGYADALNLEREATRIARGHKRVQRENHLGPKMFGVEE